MNRHLTYLGYVLRHRAFVFSIGLRLHVPLWRLLVHDLSKFRPDEWFPFVAYIYPPRLLARTAGQLTSWSERRRSNFERALLRHYRRNPHHWQHWTLINDSGARMGVEMPVALAREMVADWIAAGRVQGRLQHTFRWYEERRTTITLHPDTRNLVETLLRTYTDEETPTFEEAIATDGAPQPAS